MKITVEKLKSLHPCNEGFKWYLENIKTEELKDILIQLNDHRPEWSRWLFTKLMTKNQCVEIAIFSANEVLHIFENKYPDDKRPRKAIEAALNYLKNSSSISVDGAAYVANVAAYAADVAAYAAYAADAARKELQLKIVNEAVRILEIKGNL